MSRFRGSDVEVQGAYDDEDETYPEFNPGADEITVKVKAFLSFSIYVQSAQINRSRMILVTDTETLSDTAEKFIGVDGETGETVEVTVSYPK